MINGHYSFSWMVVGVSGVHSVPVPALVEAGSSCLNGNVTTQPLQTGANTAKEYGSNIAPAASAAALRQVGVTQRKF